MIPKSSRKPSDLMTMVTVDNHNDFPLIVTEGVLSVEPNAALASRMPLPCRQAQP